MKWKDALPPWLGMEETPPGLPLTEIAGDRRVLIENHLALRSTARRKYRSGSGLGPSAFRAAACGWP